MQRRLRQGQQRSRQGKKVQLQQSAARGRGGWLERRERREAPLPPLLALLGSLQRWCMGPGIRLPLLRLLVLIAGQQLLVLVLMLAPTPAPHQM
jgi:hypothetical protein